MPQDITENDSTISEIQQSRKEKESPNNTTVIVDDCGMSQTAYPRGGSTRNIKLWVKRANH